MPCVINSTAVIKCPEQTEHAINATNRAPLIAQEISSSTFRQRWDLKMNEYIILNLSNLRKP